MREAMKLTGTVGPIEVTTIGDVPAGAGMGSSSSLTVGVLHALHAMQGRYVGREQLATEACRIEIDILKNPIGRQDQYAAAFGGMNYFRFNSDHTVDVEPVTAGPEFFDELERRALLLYTGHQRDANTILARLSNATADRRAVLTEMRDLAGELRSAILCSGDLDRFAAILHQGWELKRSLGLGISGERGRRVYCAARRRRAGCKPGRRRRGFMLILAQPTTTSAYARLLKRPQELPFRVDRAGSRRRVRQRTSLRKGVHHGGNHVCDCQNLPRQHARCAGLHQHRN